MQQDIPAEYLDQIVTGDARVLSERIPDESVDLIFTDPPYPHEYLHLYGWLAKTAARVLRPGGLCVVQSGHFDIFSIGNLMSPHLSFFWISGIGSRDRKSPIFPRKMWARYKPVLWFQRPGPIKKDWTFDFWDAVTFDKSYHKWQQPIGFVEYYIARLSRQGDTLFDPFAGGGTVPAVCKMLGRHYVAFEIAPDAAERARQRVALTQPMHPMFLVEQESFV